MGSVCRDCNSLLDDTLTNCSICGSARLISHDFLFDLNIAHIDCDAFYAAIEKRDDPSLQDKPVLVGGGRRGVVSTCCYIARLYGVRSAMPMFKALDACPNAVVVSPDYSKYSAAAKLIREKMSKLTPLVQVVSIDEAYLDLSGTTRINEATPAQALTKLALEIERDVGITISVGLSENKFLAKTASELDKPRGFAAISQAEAPELLADHAPDFLHGVGPKLAATLKRDGYPFIRALQQASRKDLINRYGETGLWLHERAFGRDNRPVKAESERKSVSSETTFNKDMSDPAALEDQLWKLCLKTADRAKAVETEGRVVTLKLKTSDFKALTRRTSLDTHTQLAQTLFRTARPMLAKEANGRRFRLIGVGISELREASEIDAVDLLDPLVEKRAMAERAADIAREKFGKEAVKTGRTIRIETDTS